MICFNKKAAMFGLCRVLRKQSERLFLTSSQSVDSKETRVEHQFKRAAMFGLDARIALAIFGALSVISGAALYSAIQQAKVVAIVTDMREVHKAFEQYWLDTSAEMPRLTAGSVAFMAKELISNDAAKTGWKGPYLPYAKHATLNHVLIYPNYDYIQILGRSLQDPWGGTTGIDIVLPSTCKGAEEPCGRWVVAESLPISLAEAIDLYVDGVAGYKDGNLKVYNKADGTAIIYLADGIVNPTP